MDPDRKNHLLRILADAKIADSEQWLEEEQKYGTPVLEKALFMREVWAPILREGDTSWIDKSVADLEARIGRSDLYALRFLPQEPGLLAALHHVRSTEVEPAALTHIVRKAQLSVLGWIISILDGGHCFGDGLSSNWSLCSDDEDGNPSQPFANMQELVWLFDPDRKDA